MAKSSWAFSWGYVILVGKFMLLFVDTGIAKSFGVLIPTMVERLDSDYATVGFICSMPVTIMFICSPFVTLLLRKLNNRFVAVSGGLLTGSSILAFAFIKNIIAAAVCLALSGIGLSLSLMSLMLALNDFFPERFNFINTLTLYGYTAGSMVVPVITERAFEAYGYTGAFVILGGISLNLVVCGATVRKPPRTVDSNDLLGESHEKKEQTYLSQDATERKLSSNVNLNGQCESEHAENEEKMCLIEGEMIHRTPTYDDDVDQECLIESNDLQCHLQDKNLSEPRTKSLLQTCKGSFGLLNEPLFLFSLPIHFCVFYTIYAWVLFLVPHAEQLGIAQSQAIFLSTIGGLGGIIGRTLFIFLLTKGINAFIIYITISVLCTASFLLDFISSAYTVRAVLAFVQGFCIFIEDTVPVALSKDAVLDKNNFDMAISVSLCTGGLGATCAGVFTGYLFDVTQSFTKVFTIIGFTHAVTVVHLTIVTILLKKRR